MKASVLPLGYTIIPTPRSTNKNGDITICKVLPLGSDEKSNALLPSFFLKSRQIPKESLIVQEYRNILKRVNEIDFSKFNFYLFDDKNSTIKENLLLYLHPRITESYLEYIDFTVDCGINLRGSSILDLGTAFGVLPYLISKTYGADNLIGADVEADYITLAKELFPSVRYVNLGLESLLGKEKFDVVYCTQTLEHMAYPVKSVRELMTLVKPGGHLVLAVPDGRADTYSSNGLRPNSQSYIGHVNFWSIESWKSFIQESIDFRVCHIAIRDGHSMFAAIQAP